MITTTATKRKFILFDHVDNHNKEYVIELNPNNTFTATWGRVGGGTQTKTKSGGIYAVEKVIDEKIRKGYVEIDLHELPDPAVQTQTQQLTSSTTREVIQLIADLAHEAGEAISRYLSVKVDALSLGQITKGRDALNQISNSYQQYMLTKSTQDWGELLDKMTAFYNTIPTVLPHNLRDPGVLKSTILHFCFDFPEQEQRLDQLEAAIASLKVQTNNTATGQTLSLLGNTLIELLDKDDPEYIKVRNFFEQTPGAKVGHIFSVTIPSERTAYQAETFGKNNVMELTHGSRMSNFRHILFDIGLGSGLRIPTHYTNGWMFGAGIYFADNATKSMGYCSSGKRYNVMAIADVAIGTPYRAKYSDSSLRQAPAGFHSTIGEAGQVQSRNGGHLLRNEYIIYKNSQQSIKYLVTY